MAFEMIGQGVEHAIDFRLIGKMRRLGADPVQQCRALRLVGEEAVDIAGADRAAGRSRAIPAAVVETQHRPRAIRPRGDADMHLVTGKSQALRNRNALAGA